MINWASSKKKCNALLRTSYLLGVQVSVAPQQLAMQVNGVYSKKQRKNYYPDKNHS